MIKLAMIIPSLKKGGAERIFSFLANELDKEKFKITLFVFDGDNIQFNIREDNVTVINLKKRSIIKGAYFLVNQLNSLKPDVIFSTVTHLNILMGILRPFIHKCKIIVRESSVISINNKYQSFPEVFNLLIKLFYKRLDFIICQSNDMADDLINNFSIPHKNIVVINNPVTSEICQISINNKKPVKFLSVGRLVATKGLERLIDVVSQLDFDFEFVIVGSGPEFYSLQQKIKSLSLQDRIILAGEINNLESFYDEADFYLHGSYYEGFPNTFLEACSHGVPVITYNTLGGINEIIKNGINGFIANDNEEYYQSILMALNYDWDRNLIQKDIFHRFSKNVILSLYEDVLTS